MGNIALPFNSSSTRPGSRGHPYRRGRQIWTPTRSGGRARPRRSVCRSFSCLEKRRSVMR